MRGSAKLYAGYAVVMLAGLAQLKLLSIHLDKVHLGMYFALQSAIALVAEMSKLGFPLVFGHYVPKMLAEKQDTGPLGFWAFILHLGSGVVTALVCLVLYFLVKGEFVAHLPLAVAMFFPMVHYSLLSSFILSSRRPGLYSLLNAISGLSYALALFGLGSRLNLASALASGAVVYSTLSVVTWAVVRPAPGSTRILKQIASYWKYAIMTTVLSPIFVYADRLIAAGFLSYEAVAVFGVARKIETVGRNLLGVPIDVLAPESSHAWLEEDRESFLSSLRRFTRLYLLWALAGIVLIPVLGKPAILLVSSDQYVSALPYLLVLWIGATLSTLYYPYTTVARGVGNMRIFFLSDLLWTTSYLAFAFATTGPWGLWGLSLAPVVASGVALVFTRIAIFRFLRERRRGFWIEGACFAAASGFGLAGLLNPLWAIGSGVVVIAYGFWAILSRR